MTDKATLDDFETIKQRFLTATEQNLELIHELMTSNNDLAQVLQDMHTLCDQHEFKPEIFIDFIGQGKKRQIYAVPPRLSPETHPETPVTP
ncbi:MAG: hypothetical protein D4R81_03435 [Nitrospiraceae bacterium]|nr:MAG: hypothetical protein D4R81_03435 [Nitrospiraceae bacterium]